MASIVGQALGGPRLPWNPRKGWVGFAAFVVFGTMGAALLAAWTLRLPLGAWASPAILALMLPLALACALVESMPTTLDDNLTVPLAGACVLPLLVMAEPRPAVRRSRVRARLILGLAVNAAIAALAWKARSIDRAGAVSAIVIGTLITAALGLAGLAVMVAFFVVGSGATRSAIASRPRGGSRRRRAAPAGGATRGPTAASPRRSR